MAPHTYLSRAQFELFTPSCTGGVKISTQRLSSGPTQHTKRSPLRAAFTIRDARVCGIEYCKKIGEEEVPQRLKMKGNLPITQAQLVRTKLERRSLPKGRTTGSDHRLDQSCKRSVLPKSRPFWAVRRLPKITPEQLNAKAKIKYK